MADQSQGDYRIKMCCGIPSESIYIERYPNLTDMSEGDLKNAVYKLSEQAYTLLQERNDLKFLNTALINRMKTLNSSLITEMNTLAATLDGLRADIESTKV